MSEILLAAGVALYVPLVFWVLRPVYGFFLIFAPSGTLPRWKTPCGCSERKPTCAGIR